MNEWFNEFLNNYGIIAVFVVVMLEYACFPLPSEVVLPMAGLISVEMQISVWLIILLSIIAGLIGSLICYSIGYFGGAAIVKKIMIIFPKSEKSINFATKEYHKYSNLSVCIGRVIPLCRTMISFIAGAAKQNLGKYIFYTIIGISVWNTVLVLLGYIFYDNLDFIINLIKKYQIYAMFLSLFILLLIIIYFIKKWRKMKTLKN